ncbi:MAG: ribosome-associated translation inhibitor RaiA [Candidatus Paceibacterota bacterium]|jgi:putative sigma-54 modulation protein
MRINNIKTTHIELTEAIGDYIQKRVGMLGKVIDGNDTSASVAVEVGKRSNHHRDGDFFFAEITARVAGKDFRAVSEKDDLYAAIDEAKDQIIEEVTGYKDKRRTLVRRGGAAIKNILKGMGGIGGRIKSFRFRRLRK